MLTYLYHMMNIWKMKMKLKMKKFLGENFLFLKYGKF